MRIDCLFLDDGGVISDNRQRSRQWPPLVGEYFAPRLGRLPAEWAAANEAVIRGVSERMQERWEKYDPSLLPHGSLEDAYRLDWLEAMAGQVGIDLPASQDERLALAQAAEDWIEPQVQAAYPGAVETVKLLAKDYRLYTASGGSSRELTVRLTALGVASLFERLYGADLIGTPKAVGHPYHSRLFVHAGVDPSHCALLDDGIGAVEAARSLGAIGVLVGDYPEAAFDGPIIRSLAELPSLLDTL